MTSAPLNDMAALADDLRDFIEFRTSHLGHGDAHYAEHPLTLAQWRDVERALLKRSVAQHFNMRAAAMPAKKGCEMGEAVNHPPHYGGADNPYEAIKVIEAWGLGFCLGNTIKYISRAGRKSDPALQELKKARWYLDREIANLEKANGSR